MIFTTTQHGRAVQAVLCKSSQIGATPIVVSTSTDARMAGVLTRFEPGDDSGMGRGSSILSASAKFLKVTKWLIITSIPPCLKISKESLIANVVPVEDHIIPDRQKRQTMDCTTAVEAARVIKFGPSKCVKLGTNFILSVGCSVKRMVCAANSVSQHRFVGGCSRRTETVAAPAGGVKLIHSQVMCLWKYIILMVATPTIDQKILTCFVRIVTALQKVSGLVTQVKVDRANNNFHKSSCGREVRHRTENPATVVQFHVAGPTQREMIRASGRDRLLIGSSCNTAWGAIPPFPANFMDRKPDERSRDCLESSTRASAREVQVLCDPPISWASGSVGVRAAPGCNPGTLHHSGFESHLAHHLMRL